MPQKLDNGGAQIIFMIVLVCFCPNPHNRYNKVAAGGKFSSFIIDSWFIIFIEFSFQKVSIHHNEQNGQGYIKSQEEKLCQPRSVHGVSVM